MDILYLLIPLSVVLAVAIGVSFWMAVDGGQFDDLEAPALRVVADDDRPPPPPTGEGELFDTHQSPPPAARHTHSRSNIEAGERQ